VEGVVGGSEDVVDVEGAVGTENGDEIGGGSGNSKISTTFEYHIWRRGVRSHNPRRFRALPHFMSAMTS
jgi:hypothetical protein